MNEQCEDHKRKTLKIAARSDPDALPKNFIYRSGFGEGLFLGVGMVGFVGGFTTFVSLLHGLWSVDREMGFWWALAAGALMLPLAGVYTLAAAAMLISCRETYERRFQELTLTTEGVIYRDEDRRIEASWSEVERVYRPLGPCWRQTGPDLRIETTAGSFDVTRFIRDYRQLRPLLRRLCPAAVEAGAAGIPDTETLVAAPSRPGEKQYHYRLRTNRAMVALYSSMFLLPGVSLLIQLTGLAHGTSSTSDLMWITGAGAIAAAILIWIYRSSGIITTAKGITQYGPLFRRTLGWQDVVEYWKDTQKSSTFPLAVIAGRDKKIRFFMNISNWEALQAEVQRNALFAVTKEWGARKPGRR